MTFLLASPLEEGQGRSPRWHAIAPVDLASTRLPLVLGVEAAGVVVAVGSDVEGFAPGDDVMGTTAPGHGSYAEHAVLLAQDTTHKPPQISFVQAAALPAAGGGRLGRAGETRRHRR